MALLRRVIGDALRARRQGQRRTLREVSTAANVSLGYLSEIERGQKEASSELLAAICDALGARLSEVLRDASDTLARSEFGEAATAATGADRALAAAGDRAVAPAGDRPLVPAGADAMLGHAGRDGAAEGRVVTVTDGRVSVAVRRDGPLRTTLRAVRTHRPGQPMARVP